MTYVEGHDPYDLEEKNLYWKLEDNGDISVTCESFDQCMVIMKADILDSDKTKIIDNEYTISVVYLTKKEFENLPDGNW